MLSLSEMLFLGKIKKLSLLSLLSLTPSQANVVFQLPASGGFKDIFKDNRDNRDNSWRKKRAYMKLWLCCF